MKRKLIFDEKNLRLLANRLKEVRDEKKISQEELAYRSNLALSQIARIETLRINPTISTIFCICKALEIKPSQLLDFDLLLD